MSTNLKTKKGNWTGVEFAVLLEKVEKGRPYIFETAPIHRERDDFERPWKSPHARWKLQNAKNCKAVGCWTIGCVAYVRGAVLCRSGTMVSNTFTKQSVVDPERVQGVCSTPPFPRF